MRTNTTQRDLKFEKSKAGLGLGSGPGTNVRSLTGLNRIQVPAINDNKALELNGPGKSEATGVLAVLTNPSAPHRAVGSLNDETPDGPAPEPGLWLLTLRANLSDLSFKYLTPGTSACADSEHTVSIPEYAID